MDFELLEEIFLESDDLLIVGYWQPLEYPKFWYLSHYDMVGHTVERCKRLYGK